MIKTEISNVNGESIKVCFVFHEKLAEEITTSKKCQILLLAEHFLTLQVIYVITCRENTESP